MSTETIDRPDSQQATAATQEPAQAAQASAQPGDERAKFDSIMRKHNAAPTTGQPNGEQAKQTTGEQGTNEREQAAESANTDEPAKPALTDRAKEYAAALGITTEDSNALLDTAIEAYRRQNVLDADDITEKWRRNPDKFIESGLKLAKTQKDQDTFGGEYREFQKNPEAFIERFLSKRQGDGRQAQAEQPKPLPQRVNEKITSALNGVKFTNDLGEFDQEAFAQSFGVTLTQLAEELAAENTASVQSLKQQHEAEIQQRDQQIEHLRQSWVDQQLMQARSQLASKYPDLARDDVWQKVLSEPGGYDDLAASGKFATVADAVARAAAGVLGEETTQSIRARLLTEHTMRKNGQARPPTPVASTKPLDKQTQDRVAFDQLLKKHKV